MVALDKNEAWDLVELSSGRNLIGNKLVFKKKLNAKGKVEKYKAWLVAKGEIFSLVAKLTSIRFLLSVVVAFNFELE
jgi:hypothetical protein